MDRFSVFPAFTTSPLLSARLAQPLAIVGGLYLAYQLQTIGNWTWTHLIRQGKPSKYKSRTGDTWALITGASDGIGKGFAQELAEQGFEIILHGRNEVKLAGVRDALQTQYPQRKFKLLILDADSFSIEEMETKVSEIRGLNIRILVNNVAGGGAHEKPVFNPLQNRTPENIDGWTNITARFPTHLTRFLLPTLMNKESSLIMNIGSGVSEMSIAYLGVYSGLKAYNKVWSRCLQMEMRVDGHDNVEVIAIIVGEVATEKSKRKPSLFVPSSRQMAKSSLAAIGSGKKEIYAYWGHALQSAIFTLLPTSFFDNYGLNVVRKMRTEEEVEMKQ